VQWLKTVNITVAEDAKESGKHTLTFTGKRGFPWDGRPQWYVLVLKETQTKVRKREIEALLRHFAQGQLEVPRAADCTAIAVQPVLARPAKSSQIEN